MDNAPRLLADTGRRVATIEGQLGGIERLFQKGDIPQALTQSAAVQNALESLVKILLQVSITNRFEMETLGERPEDAFERALERAMTYWFSVCPNGHEQAGVVDGPEFWSTIRDRTRAIQDQLRDVSLVLEKQNYLEGLRELGAVHHAIGEMSKLVLWKFVKDRMGDKADSKKGADLFGRTVTDALKYWHLPDPKVVPDLPKEIDAKILVVDDDPDVVEYVTHVLNKRPCRVVTAPDAEEAMRKVESEKPDLIILDIMMPQGIEGFQFTWRLRARPEPEYRKIPIIVLSAIHGTTDLRFYPDQSDGYYGPGEFLPVEAFMDKPVRAEDLLQQVERVLRIARQTAGAST